MNYLEIFKGKRVLITGHTGFKGGWLALWLHSIGAEVAGYSLDPLYREGIFCSAEIHELIRDYRGDIRNLGEIKQLIKSFQPEFVFHLAAQPIVLHGYHNPVETFEVNVQGTVNILEAIRLTSSVKVAVIVTTDKCYQNMECPWGYREIDPLGGNEPYSASKGAAELVVNAYRRSYFSDGRIVGLASVRAGNVIGGGDFSENRLVPDIIKAIKDSRTIEIRNPHSIRPWQYVLEPIAGYLKLASLLYEKPSDYSEAWNFGPYNNETHEVKELVEAVIHYSGLGKWKDVSDIDVFCETNILKLDISKALMKLKWKPVLDFDEAIKMTVDWYFNTGNIYKFSLDQIKMFKKRCKL